MKIGLYAGMHDDALRYIALLEEVTGAPAGILSLGPRRAETLFRERPR